MLGVIKISLVNRSALSFIDGAGIAVPKILKLRREQRKAARQPQSTLFELKNDCRPASQRTAEGRLTEPMLFEVN